MTTRLVIGSRNQCPWSLATWLAMRMFEVPFEEVLVPLDRPESEGLLERFSPSGKVPVLVEGSVTVWESLAILEHLAERHPAMWPQDPACRARARSLAAEIHGGFAALHRFLPMDLVARFAPPGRLMRQVGADLKRIRQIWTELRGAGPGLEGDFLFGRFTIVDAMFAPIASRFVTYALPPQDPVCTSYVQALIALPAMREWSSEAASEVAAFARVPAEPFHRRAAEPLRHPLTGLAGLARPGVPPSGPISSHPVPTDSPAPPAAPSEPPFRIPSPSSAQAQDQDQVQPLAQSPAPARPAAPAPSPQATASADKDTRPSPASRDRPARPRLDEADRPLITYLDEPDRPASGRPVQPSTGAEERRGAAVPASRPGIGFRGPTPSAAKGGADDPAGGGVRRDAAAATPPAGSSPAAASPGPAAVPGRRSVPPWRAGPSAPAAGQPEVAAQAPPADRDGETPPARLRRPGTADAKPTVWSGNRFARVLGGGREQGPASDASPRPAGRPAVPAERTPATRPPETAVEEHEPARPRTIRPSAIKPIGFSGQRRR